MPEKQRKIHPNSIKALKDAAAAREVTKTRVNMTLTPAAIVSLDTLATHIGISRSELVESLARLPQAELLKLLGKE